MDMRFITYVNGVKISDQPVEDPIARTTMRMGLRDRVRFLFSEGKVVVNLQADHEATCVIMGGLREFRRYVPKEGPPVAMGADPQ